VHLRRVTPRAIVIELVSLLLLRASVACERAMGRGVVPRGTAPQSKYDGGFEQARNAWFKGDESMGREIGKIAERYGAESWRERAKVLFVTAPNASRAASNMVILRAKRPQD
jgi:hypothetical protein